MRAACSWKIILTRCTRPVSILTHREVCRDDNSSKALNIFTHGPGHCLNTPAIQLEILNLWECSGRHEEETD